MLELVREREGWAEALVCEYRRAAGLANAEPRDEKRHQEIMWEMRGAEYDAIFAGRARTPLVGWQDAWGDRGIQAGPSGLTRLGALVAAELNRTRGRRRQVAEAVAQEEIRRRSMDRGQLLHELLRDSGLGIPAKPADEVIAVTRDMHEAWSKFGQSAVDATRAVTDLTQNLRTFDGARFTFKFHDKKPITITGLSG